MRLRDPVSIVRWSIRFESVERSLSSSGLCASRLTASQGAPMFSASRGSNTGSFYLACEEAFKLIDKNGDGVLSRIEVIQVRLGHIRCPCARSTGGVRC